MTANELVEPAWITGPSYTRTLGPEVAALSELAGFVPDPEQRVALDATFALGPDGRAASFEVAVVACRQNLKTGLFKQCALGWLFITDQRLIVWSAHEFATAKEAHRDLVELIEGCDPLRKRVKAIHRANGEEGIELRTGQRINFKARTNTGGRGLSGDKVVLDEAFALQDSHLGTLVPLLSVRPDPQLVIGSSAGLGTSHVLRNIRDRGRAGTDPSLSYVEWSDDLPGDCQLGDMCSHAVGEVGCRLDDQRRWARANSQLGRRLSLEYVEHERRMLPPAEFARERLGWWDEIADTAPAFDLDAWAALADPAAQPIPRTVWGIATAPDRSWCAVAGAWRRPADGLTQVALSDFRPGTAWACARVAELRKRWSNGPVVVDVPSRGLVPGAIEPALPAQAQAHAALSDAVAAGSLRHGNEPALTVAVREARWRTSGDSLGPLGHGRYHSRDCGGIGGRRPWHSPPPRQVRELLNAIHTKSSCGRQRHPGPRIGTRPGNPWAGSAALLVAQRPRPASAGTQNS